ncbi:Mannosyl-oligosaccharide glucosidase [Nymphon striatum]|nr:Mannosyl-oligosaccharide glucosidase [Nymphon striatum]
MVRQRKVKSKQENSNTNTPKESKLKSKEFLKNIVYGLLSIALVLLYYYSKNTSKSLINTPLPAPRAVVQEGLRVPDRYWGTYRPGVYFGTKTRSGSTLATGLLWFKHELENQRLPIRHLCDQANKLPRYGWLRHDGINFGEQEIVDYGFSVNTTFVKRPGGSHGGDWSAKISVTPKSTFHATTPISLMYYVSTDQIDDFQFNPTVIDGDYLEDLHGISNELGRFVIRFPQKKNQEKGKLIHSSYLVMRGPGLHTISEIAEQMIIYNQKRKQMEKPGAPVKIALPGHVKLPEYPGEANVFIFEVTILPPYEFEVVFESLSYVDRPASLSGNFLTKSIEENRLNFDLKFEKTFGLKSKRYSEKEQAFAKHAMSNMLGGIGYFTGQSIVQAANSHPVNYWLANLYTAVPSRSFFPRGFLWDEGFHNLLISKWDSSISMDIISHWMDLMNTEGWIPREVILGPEAQARVPLEFVIQRNTNANPPTFFLTVDSLMKHMVDKKSEKNVQFLKLLYPRLQAIYSWMNSSQKGKRPGTYYWRGRNQSAIQELNPKTLASGLDDYPRASHPNDNEAHLDLRCWMALASSVLSDIAKVIGQPHSEYEKTAEYLTNNEILDSVHWSEEHQRYLDFGLHTEDVKLYRPQNPPKPGQRPQKLPKIRQVGQKPKLQFVNSFGYVSLFPFLLQIIKPDSPKLEKIFSDITNRDFLWTNYGLRSLSKDSSIYMKRNTEHDPPYWRAPVWININFLAVRALHYYSTTPGPYKDRAAEIYQALRSNIIKNMVKEYERTGYIWEQYNDKTGFGQGVHPFTGWSSLVVLMMAETY